MENGRWTPRGQGDIGEMSAMAWLARQGATVFIPVGHSPDCDLIADFGERVERVQVKTSSFSRSGRWEVAVCTRGGNQSWNGLVKRLDRTRYEFLFAHVGDGRRWFIPSMSVDGGNLIRLGGPKYAAWEIEPGEALLARTPTLD